MNIKLRKRDRNALVWYGSDIRVWFTDMWGRVMLSENPRGYGGRGPNSVAVHWSWLLAKQMVCRTRRRQCPFLFVWILPRMKSLEEMRTRCMCFFFSFSLCENAGGWIGRPKDEAHGRQNSVKTSKCAAATNSLLLASSYVAWNRDWQFSRALVLRNLRASCSLWFLFQKITF